MECLTTATKRNLMFNPSFYIDHFFKKGNKMESGRLCHESSEDAVSYNVFTELLRDKDALQKLVKLITGTSFSDEIHLYLWGSRINLMDNKSALYIPLVNVREALEQDIKNFKTEPDIMLVIPKKLVICIEAKFGSKNPIAKDIDEVVGEKPKKISRLQERYCEQNKIIVCDKIFNFMGVGGLFYEQLFRNVVFAASMAQIEGTDKWYVANLRNQHVMNLQRGKPGSKPVKRNIRALLHPEYKKRFTHLTREDVYETAVKDSPSLRDLTWYMKNKSLACGRAFNIL